jgi:hypothetical protein
MPHDVDTASICCGCNRRAQLSCIPKQGKSLPLLHGKVSFSGQTPFEAAFRAPEGATFFEGWSPQ